MTTSQATGRGETWLTRLTADAPRVRGFPPSVQIVDGSLGALACRWIAVVPDLANPFPRARGGEVGLLEGWSLALAVRQAVDADRGGAPRAIVAVVDVTSQAYGRREEAFGIHQALAAAAAAYGEARMAGHPVIALIVGKAMSGAFLAHGYQANRLLALDAPGVMVHAMGVAAAARVTQRSVEQLHELADSVPPMAYDIGRYASLGLLWRLLAVSDADGPTTDDLALARRALEDALRDIQADGRRDLGGRLGGEHRQATARVRERLAALW